LQQHQADLAAIQINDAVLADGEAIEAIHHATTTYREARIQSAKAEAASETAQGNFDFVLRQIAGDEKPVDPLQWIPDPTRTAKIRALITSGATLKATHQANLKTRREKKLEIDQLDAEILSLGQEYSSEDLAAYLDSIADYGDPEVRAQQLEDEATASEAKLNTDAREVKMDSAAAVARTTVPLDAELQVFRSEDEELRRRAHSIRRRSKKSRTISPPCRAISRDSKSAATCRPGKPSSLSEKCATRCGWVFAAISCRSPAKPCRQSHRHRPSATKMPSPAPMTLPTACSPMLNEPPVTPSFESANPRCKTASTWKENAKQRSPGNGKISISAGPPSSPRTACRP
jgi:hypothetical protein